jgi:hypothetical protein
MAGAQLVLPILLAPDAAAELGPHTPSGNDTATPVLPESTEGYSRTSPDAVVDTLRTRGPILPPSLLPPENRYLALGVALEGFGRSFDNGDAFGGLAAVYRLRSLGPQASLLVRPSERGIQAWRLLTGLGLRGYLPVGSVELSYGVGVYLEARMLDHYWLAHAMPLEVGAVLSRSGSWNIELFVGARYAFAGKLINSFLIDPNGFDNEDAQSELEVARDLKPWRGFLRVVFARRID